MEYLQMYQHFVHILYLMTYKIMLKEMSERGKSKIITDNQTLCRY